MVIFEDLQKLLLYQRLNLGFECDICNRKFYNRLDHLHHTSNCKKVSEPLKCSKCGKTFGHQKILQLHMQFHNLGKTPAPAPPTNSDVKCETVELSDSESDETSPLKGGSRESETGTNTLPPPPPPTNFLERRQTVTDVVESILKINESHIKDNLPSIKILEPPKKSSSHKTKGRSKPVKKAIGLTKVKMEDCLRCDACSCIYIDDKDYYKHMRNFHQVDVTNNLPIPQPKSKRKCRSCCKQCRGAHCTSVKRPRATQRASNLIFKINMQNNIQDRWTRMVSQQLSESPMPEFQSVPDIKSDPDTVTIKPDPDLSHLLSQVEVRIKTEPEDYCV
uniref:C2H2-type domain-containing protein n=1 Tax=Graphocephala atropunctata TaxID=36148 RepID=A0A1B6K951_9HEMI